MIYWEYFYILEPRGFINSNFEKSKEFRKESQILNWYKNQMGDIIIDQKIKGKTFLHLEPIEIRPDIYNYGMSFFESFETVFTHDKELLSQLPNGKYVTNGGFWVNPNYICNQKKNKVSFPISQKRWASGHKNRWILKEMIENDSELNDFVDIFVSPYNDKSPIIGDYKYTIVIENSIIPGYYTEKILDPLVLETVPLYIGDPTIKETFDIEHQFFKPEELYIFLKDLKKSEMIVNKNKTSILKEKALKIGIIEDTLIEHFKPML